MLAGSKIIEGLPIQVPLVESEYFQVCAVVIEEIVQVVNEGESDIGSVDNASVVAVFLFYRTDGLFNIRYIPCESVNLK
jgi:hypothetical protein